MTIEKIGWKYSGILNTTITVISVVNFVLDNVFLVLPAIVLRFIMASLSLIADQMVNADTNHNGVYLKFQQFVLPLGFGPR